MRTLKFILINTILLFSIKLSGQDSTKVKKFICLPIPNSFGYIWQGSNNVDLAFQPMLLLDAKRNHSNIGLVIAGNLLFYNNSSYLTPTTKLRIMLHDRKRILDFGWVASIGHSYTNVHSKYDHRITPEVGIKIWLLDATIGYNIPISNYRDSFTNDLRVAIRFNTH